MPGGSLTMRPPSVTGGADAAGGLATGGVLTQMMVDGAVGGALMGGITGESVAAGADSAAGADGRSRR